MVSVVLLLLFVTVLIARAVNNRNTTTLSQETIQFGTGTTTPPNEVRRFLDGVMVPTGRENLFPIAVVMENLVTIRPQSGLQAANVVYEALAEGGITRFLAVYSSDFALPEIGPVRSARSYFLDWAKEYGGLYVHVGGSPDALQTLRTTDAGVVNLDQIQGDAPYFWRKKEIPPPHNLFTSSELLVYALKDRGVLEKQSTFRPWKFTSPRKTEERPTEEKYIAIDYFSASYKVEYTYDRTGNVYRRMNGGLPHHDKLTKEQIRVTNVVVQFVATSLLDEESGRLTMQTTGEGRAVVFRNGEAVEGIWRKNDATGMRTIFVTQQQQQEEEIEFVPGNIWIEVLPEGRTLSYS